MKDIEIVYFLPVITRVNWWSC